MGSSNFNQLMTYLGYECEARDNVPLRECLDLIVSLSRTVLPLRPIPDFSVDGNKVEFLMPGTVANLDELYDFSRKYPKLVIGTNPDCSKYKTKCYLALYDCFGLSYPDFVDRSEMPMLKDVLDDFLPKLFEARFDVDMNIPIFDFLAGQVIHFSKASSKDSAWTVDDLVEIELSGSQCHVDGETTNSDFMMFYKYKNLDRMSLFRLFLVYPTYWNKEEDEFTAEPFQIVSRPIPVPSWKKRLYEQIVLFWKEKRPEFHDAFFRLLKTNNLDLDSASRLNVAPKIHPKRLEIAKNPISHLADPKSQNRICKLFVRKEKLHTKEQIEQLFDIIKEDLVKQFKKLKLTEPECDNNTKLCKKDCEYIKDQVEIIDGIVSNLDVYKFNSNLDVLRILNNVVGFSFPTIEFTATGILGAEDTESIPSLSVISRISNKTQTENISGIFANEPDPLLIETDHVPHFTPTFISSRSRLFERLTVVNNIEQTAKLPEETTPLLLEDDVIATEAVMKISSPAAPIHNDCSLDSQFNDYVMETISDNIYLLCLSLISEEKEEAEKERNQSPSNPENRTEANMPLSERTEQFDVVKIAQDQNYESNPTVENLSFVEDMCYSEKYTDDSFLLETNYVTPNPLLFEEMSTIQDDDSSALSFSLDVQASVQPKDLFDPRQKAFLPWLDEKPIEHFSDFSIIEDDPKKREETAAFLDDFFEKNTRQLTYSEALKFRKRSDSESSSKGQSQKSSSCQSGSYSSSSRSLRFEFPAVEKSLSSRQRKTGKSVVYDQKVRKSTWDAINLRRRTIKEYVRFPNDCYAQALDQMVRPFGVYCTDLFCDDRQNDVTEYWEKLYDIFKLHEFGILRITILNCTVCLSESYDFSHWKFMPSGYPQFEETIFRCETCGSLTKHAAENLYKFSEFCFWMNSNFTLIQNYQKQNSHLELTTPSEDVFYQGKFLCGIHYDGLSTQGHYTVGKFEPNVVAITFMGGNLSGVYSDFHKNRSIRSIISELGDFESLQKYIDSNRKRRSL